MEQQENSLANLKHYAMMNLSPQKLIRLTLKWQDLIKYIEGFFYLPRGVGMFMGHIFKFSSLTRRVRNILI